MTRRRSVEAFFHERVPPTRTPGVCRQCCGAFEPRPGAMAYCARCLERMREQRKQRREREANLRNQSQGQASKE